MALQRIKKVYSNPWVLKSAINLTKLGKSREEVITHLHSKYFPQYSREAVAKAFSPKFGYSKRIVDAIESLHPNRNTPLLKRTAKDVFREVLMHRRAMSANVEAQRANPALDALRRQKQKQAMRELHKDPNYKNKLNTGTQAYWSAFLGTAEEEKFREASSARLHERNRDPAFAKNREDGHRMYWDEQLDGKSAPPSIASKNSVKLANQQLHLPLSSETNTKNLRKVHGIFSNPNVLERAINLAAEGKTLQEIVAVLHKKYFQKYYLEELAQAFLVKGGPNKGIVNEIVYLSEFARKMHGDQSKNRDAALKRVLWLSRRGNSKVRRINRNPTLKRIAANKASEAMVQKHQDPEYRKRRFAGLWLAVMQRRDIMSGIRKQTLPLARESQKKINKRRLNRKEVRDTNMELDLESRGLGGLGGAFESEISKDGGKVSRPVSTTISNPATETIAKERELLLSNALSDLSSNERRLLEARFGLSPEVNEHQLLKELGLSELEMGAIIDSALRKLSQNKNIKALH